MFVRASDSALPDRVQHWLYGGLSLRHEVTASQPMAAKCKPHQSSTRFPAGTCGGRLGSLAMDRGVRMLPALRGAGHMGWRSTSSVRLGSQHPVPCGDAAPPSREGACSSAKGSGRLCSQRISMEPLSGDTGGKAGNRWVSGFQPGVGQPRPASHPHLGHTSCLRTLMWGTPLPTASRQG